MMYGFVTGIIMIVFNVILYVSGLAFETWSQWIAYIPFLVGLILNAMAYAKANDNYVTFGNVWSSGFKASSIITIVLLAWAILSLFIFPDMREKGLEIAQERMAQQGLSDEQIEQAVTMTNKFFIPALIGGTLISTLFMGAIFSAIAAIFPKKKGDGAPPATLS